MYAQTIKFASERNNSHHPKLGRDSSLPALSERQRPARGTDNGQFTQDLTNMTITVQGLIEKLQGYPGDAELAIEASADDQEFSIINFVPSDNKLTIVIRSEEEEEE
ncbi:MAG: hypothetical protein V7L21_29565 [Nostoc sp.]|uniref:hypothetical protein n=1 Tax=Nostoc sp. TaxID=1180 RepID=UPI002FF8B623